MELLEVRGEGAGKQVDLRMTQFGLLRNTILIEFVEYKPPHRLVDEQRRGPFKFWRQERTFRATENGTMLTDVVEYEPPFGLLGRIADRFLIAPRIRAMFEYRQMRTKELIENPKSKI